MNHRHVFLLVAAILALAAPARATEVIGVGRVPIELEANKGALIKLDKSAATVFVADPEIADVQVKSPRLIYLTAKRPGETSLYAVDSRDRIILSRRVTVSHNISRLQGTLRHLFPSSEIDVRSVNGAMLLDGSVATASDAEDVRRIAARIVDGEENLINKLAVAEPNQVHLRVRVAEVSRTVLKEFGINWEGMIRPADFVFGPGIGRDFLQDFRDPVVNQFANGGSPIKRSGANSFLAGVDSSRGAVNALIDALDSEGLITVLAEPNLTAVSGETANFLAGGEFPILIPGESGRVTVEFKQFGVSLSFTPTLIGGSTISLKVKPEVSQLSSAGAVSFAGVVIPALSTRRAETTVELGSGQTFAIAGLLQNNLSRDINRFPGLADVPILGPLFRSDQFQREESELVIIVTAYVVRPVSKPMLVAPTDGLTPPTDEDRLLHSRLYRPTLGRKPSGPNGRGAAGLVGPVGFMLD